VTGVQTCALPIWLHPLVPIRKLPADSARVMIVNKTFVDFYHARK